MVMPFVPRKQNQKLVVVHSYLEQGGIITRLANIKVYKLQFSNVTNLKLKTNKKRILQRPYRSKVVTAMYHFLLVDYLQFLSALPRLEQLAASAFTFSRPLSSFRSRLGYDVE